MSTITTFQIALEIKAGRIPVQWSAREHTTPEVRELGGRLISEAKTEIVLWPQVVTTKGGDAEVTELEDPTAIRPALFRALNTDWTAKAAVKILNAVGAWSISPSDKAEDWAKGTHATAAFRHRFLGHIQVHPLTLEDMRSEAEYWYRLVGMLGHPAKMKKAFKSPPGALARPADAFLFAAESQFSNTLPVSLEWQGKYPRAVVEPLSAVELLAAHAWADVVSETPAQVCKGCKTRFASPRIRMFCNDVCANRASSRNWKRRKKAGQSQE